MRKLCVLAVTVLAIAAMTITTFGQNAKPDPKIERGKYLAEQVARCQDCHTPKADNGEFIQDKWFKGATLNIAPMSTIPGWHKTSPDITSTSAFWERWGQDGLIAFLETAKNPKGGKAGPPMPAYTLKREDAEAIVTYLKTLK